MKINDAGIHKTTLHKFENAIDNIIVFCYFLIISNKLYNFHNYAIARTIPPFRTGFFVLKQLTLLYAGRFPCCPTAHSFLSSCSMFNVPTPEVYKEYKSRL